MKIASFDIGYRNFCFVVYEITNMEFIKAVINIPKEKRYKINGVPTPEFEKILVEIYNNSTVVCFKNTDLVKNIKKPTLPDICLNLNDYLDDNITIFNDCSVIIIESQMNINKKAGKIAQHLWSYFSFKYGRFKHIIEFPAYHKTQIIGAPKNKTLTKKGNVTYKSIDKPTRKKWAIEKAVEILNFQKDTETLSLLNNSKKKDDISDVILQAISFIYLCFIDKSI